MASVEGLNASELNSVGDSDKNSKIQRSKSVPHIPMVALGSSNDLLPSMDGVHSFFSKVFHRFVISAGSTDITFLPKYGTFI